MVSCWVPASPKKEQWPERPRTTMHTTVSGTGWFQADLKLSGLVLLNLAWEKVNFCHQTMIMKDTQKVLDKWSLRKSGAIIQARWIISVFVQNLYANYSAQNLAIAISDYLDPEVLMGERDGYFLISGIIFEPSFYVIQRQNGFTIFSLLPWYLTTTYQVSQPICHSNTSSMKSFIMVLSFL